MLPYLAEPDWMANPSSSHIDGQRAALALTECRARVAQHFACDPEHVVFNSGGSEGDTHALVGTAWLLERAVHVAVSRIEHEAVIEAGKRLRQLGHRVSYLPVTGDGLVPVEAVEQLITGDRPDLVSVMAVNNEIGTVQPVREIAALCQEREVVFHCDAVRAVGHGFGDLMRDPAISLLNCTAHKFGGPRGVGALIQRELKLPQLVCGGGQEQGSRAGTENLASIVGLAAALDLANDEEAERVEDLRRRMEHELIARFPFCEIHGKLAPRATHVTSVSLKPKSAVRLQASLDELGVAVGTGSACHEDSDEITISPVLAAMGVEEMLARGTLRSRLGNDLGGDCGGT
jgi:cysteine desulfurase